MLIFFLKVLLAHLLGDFVCQPSKWIKERNRKHYKSKYLYYHVLVHFALLFILFITELNLYFWGIIFIVLSHWIIDIAKTHIENKTNKTAVFIIDQMLHLLIIAIISWLYFRDTMYFCLNKALEIKLLLIIISCLLTTYGASIFIKIFFKKWDKESEKNGIVNEEETLPDAGKYIGILERLMLLIFINMNLLSGIGFLLAAKSIFRFGDLTRSKDKKLTEYVLMGTFLSFTIGIIIGFVLKYLLSII